MNNQLIVWLRSLPLIAGRQSKLGNRFLPTKLMNGRWCVQGYNGKKIVRPTCLLNCRAAHQSGAVLIISLIMLLLLTLIGASSVQTTSLEEKMAGNMRDQNLAFQAAESALRAGEAFLTQATLPSFTSAGTGGFYSETAITPQQNVDWSTFNTITYSTATLSNTASPPLYVIQRLSNIGSSSLDAGNYNENELYRVTARGVGSSSNAVVVLQAIYKR